MLLLLVIALLSPCCTCLAMEDYHVEEGVKE
jgi:hypothetical protein